MEQHAQALFFTAAAAGIASSGGASAGLAGSSATAAAKAGAKVAIQARGRRAIWRGGILRGERLGVRHKPAQMVKRVVNSRGERLNVRVVELQHRVAVMNLARVLRHARLHRVHVCPVLVLLPRRNLHAVVLNAAAPGLDVHGMIKPEREQLEHCRQRRHEDAVDEICAVHAHDQRGVAHHLHLLFKRLVLKPHHLQFVPAIHRLLRQNLQQPQPRFRRDQPARSALRAAVEVKHFRLDQHGRRLPKQVRPDLRPKPQPIARHFRIVRAPPSQRRQRGRILRVVDEKPPFHVARHQHALEAQRRRVSSKRPELLYQKHRPRLRRIRSFPPLVLELDHLLPHVVQLHVHHRFRRVHDGPEHALVIRSPLCRVHEPLHQVASRHHNHLIHFRHAVRFPVHQQVVQHQYPAHKMRDVPARSVQNLKHRRARHPPRRVVLRVRFFQLAHDLRYHW
mmetsp:Transcript_11955/g.26060  ORF Transcript_11955/g.26060 Transcript_11955/m.26060 type:complete len:451 (+) Transcript_11955:222-1574(+)